MILDKRHLGLTVPSAEIDDLIDIVRGYFMPMVMGPYMEDGCCFSNHWIGLAMIDAA
jgi:hypothetical protein